MVVETGRGGVGPTDGFLGFDRSVIVKIEITLEGRAAVLTKAFARNVGGDIRHRPGVGRIALLELVRGLIARAVAQQVGAARAFHRDGVFSDVLPDNVIDRAARTDEVDTINTGSGENDIFHRSARLDVEEGLLTFPLTAIAHANRLDGVAMPIVSCSSSNGDGVGDGDGRGGGCSDKAQESRNCAQWKWLHGYYLGWELVF